MYEIKIPNKPIIAVVGVKPARIDFTTEFFRMPRYGTLRAAELAAPFAKEIQVFVEAVAPVDWDFLARADLVFFSFLTPAANRAFSYAAKLKTLNPGAIIVMGDIHPSLRPSECLQHADIVVRKECDMVLRDLIQALIDGCKLEGIPGISYWSNGAVVHNSDPGTFETVDYSIGSILPRIHDFEVSDRIAFLKHRKLNLHVVQATRGCPNGCSFCLAPSLFGNTYRMQPICNVIQDLKAIKSFAKGGNRRVLFVDNNLFADRDWAIQLMDAIQKEDFRFKFIAFACSDVYEDTELLKKMRTAGIKVLFIGYETLDGRFQNPISKVQQTSILEKSVDRIQSHGIRVHGSFIFGHTDETIRNVYSTIDSAIDCGMYGACFFALTSYPAESFPGCISVKPFEDKQIFEEDYSLYTSNYVTFYPTAMRPSKLQRAMAEGYEKFYRFPFSSSRHFKADRRWPFARAAGYGMARNLIKEMYEVIPQLEGKEKGMYDEDDRLIPGKLALCSEQRVESDKNSDLVLARSRVNHLTCS